MLWPARRWTTEWAACWPPSASASSRSSSPNWGQEPTPGPGPGHPIAARAVAGRRRGRHRVAPGRSPWASAPAAGQPAQNADHLRGRAAVPGLRDLDVAARAGRRRRGRSGGRARHGTLRTLGPGGRGRRRSSSPSWGAGAGFATLRRAGDALPAVRCVARCDARHEPVGRPRPGDRAGPRHPPAAPDPDRRRCAVPRVRRGAGDRRCGRSHGHRTDRRARRTESGEAAWVDVHQSGGHGTTAPEHRLVQDTLDQVELADWLGIQYVWGVEHHFLEEYSHSSAPEVFLAACQPADKNMRLGHGIILTAPSSTTRPARPSGWHAGPRLQRAGGLRLAANSPTATPSSAVPRQAEGEARRLARGPRGRRPVHDRDALHRRRRPVGSPCRPATSSPSRCNGPTRRCGWRARVATRSCWPPRRASARSPSPSSTPRKRTTGCTTTRRRWPRRACRSAWRSTRRLRASAR